MKDLTITVGSLIASLFFCYLLSEIKEYNTIEYFVVFILMFIFFIYFCIYLGKIIKDVE